MLGAASGRGFLGPAVVIVAIAVHLFRSAHRIGEMRLILIALVLGGTWDSVLTATGLLRYPQGAPAAWLAPAWIFALWALFAITLNHSLRWLQPRLLVATGLALVAAPLSYWAGVRMGALAVGSLALTLSVEAIGWAALLPALLVIARRGRSGEQVVPT